MGKYGAQTRLHETALRLFAERGVNQLTVSELAEAAGVARGTVYNNLESPETLFEEVAARLSAEMDDRITSSFDAVADPARRLANGIRFYVRRAHEEPHWGRFIVRFAFTNQSLQALWTGPPASDLRNGLEAGRYRIREDQVRTVLGLIAGATVGAMHLVLDGHKTWREAGSDAAEFVLRALGVAAREARALATAELPPLPAAAEAASA